MPDQLRAICGARHPELRQPWGSAPECRREPGHDPTLDHEAVVFDDDFVGSLVIWRAS